MGRRRFVIFYLLCGVVAALSRAFIAPRSRIPVIGMMICVSGMISGALGVYLLLFPHARLLVMLPFGFLTKAFYVPSMLVLGLRFLSQVSSSLVASFRQRVVA